MLSTTPPPVQRPAPPRCANCGCGVAGRFCGECGQRNASRLVSVRRMISEVLDDQLTMNSAVPRTLGGLLLRPGFLTREYVAGRIVRYLAPFRLYLVSSLGFFLALALVANPARLGEQVERDIERGRAPGAERAERKNPVVSFGVWGDTARVAPWMKPAARYVSQQERRLNGLSKGELVSALVAGIERSAPKAVFLLLPLFALFLKVLYLRRKRLYVEHFIFALHIHSFAFLIFTVTLLTRSPHLTLVLLVWLLAYVFIAMRRVYGQGMLRTAVKYVVLGGTYLFALLLALVGTIIVASLTL